MRLVAIATVAASLAGVAQALAQTSLTPPRPAERDLQEMNSLMTQRAQDALRQQQQSFDANRGASSRSAPDVASLGSLQDVPQALRPARIGL
jgi:Tfp pilus assembly pilus retraction ATPase PilT